MIQILNHSNTISTQFKISHIYKRIQILNFGNLVANKIKVFKLCELIDVLDMFNLIEREIKRPIGLLALFYIFLPRITNSRLTRLFNPRICEILLS